VRKEGHIMYGLAHLSQEQVSALQQFEEKEGVRLIAMAEMDLQPAPLDAEKLSAVKDFEQQFGVCVVAVQ
jgi:hypothetical protein